MNPEITTLEPQPVWEAFASLLEIPRPSGREQRAAGRVREWASRHGFEARSDAAGNIVVDVPASAGAEGAVAVALQAHLDMVGERDAGVPHDFDSDPIAAYVDDGWVRARGTTLGADNGIGVAAAMAAATDPALAHPALQLVFTVEEETGMGGALGLDPQLVRARTLLNLDSEEDGEVVIGCAGGARATLRVPLAWREPAPGLETRRLVVSGLRGGHSGVQIHEGLGNAIRSLGRILLEARRQAGTMELAGVAGGSAENAIPREASALVRVADASLLERVANEVAATLRAELAGVDEGLSVELRSEPEPDRVVSGPDGERAIDLLAALPHGVLAMSRALRGIVETSINLGVVATDERELTIVLHARSSNEPALDGVLASVEARARLAGASVELGSRYPGWQPQPDSRLLQVTRDAYRAVYGTEPRVTAIHAGLECGALAQRLPGIEMVSFGPEIRAPHSPAERVSVESVGRFWAVLRAVLEALAAPAPG